METATLALLLGAGIAGGVVTAMVGGASLITFPALLAVGLPPVVASASNSVAMAPSNLMAAFADLDRIPRWRVAFAWTVLLAALGSAVGAWLLFITPERVFMRAVPVFIGAATLLFAFQAAVKDWIALHDDDESLRTARADRIGVVLLAPVAVYVGYFGAGAGVMLLAILSLGEHGDFRAVNVLKNLLGTAMSVVAAAMFIVGGLVEWPQALAMGTGGLVGGYAGGRLVRHIPAEAVRWAVIGVGCVLTFVYARRYWFD